MDATMRQPTDPVTFFHALEETPHAYDFFQVLRRIECLFPDKPAWGKAKRPADEPIRLSQTPSLSFAPAAIASFKQASGRDQPRLEVQFFGLLGPNGPLPLHLTEHARERLLNARDPTFSRFLDLFNHRFLALFYRAWAQAQPTVSLDRPDEDRFGMFVGALFGFGDASLRHRDLAPDHAKLVSAGLLVRHVRNAEGLRALLASYFRLPIRIEQFVGHWMGLRRNERTRLGPHSAGSCLGRGAVLGERVWDRQHNFRIHVGPLNLGQYESFLPGGRAIGELVAWVRQYLCFELDWDARLVLAQSEVPRMVLGRYGRLGWTTWLGKYARNAAAADLTLDAERTLKSFGVA